MTGPVELIILCDTQAEELSPTCSSPEQVTGTLTVNGWNDIHNESFTAARIQVNGTSFIVNVEELCQQIRHRNSEPKSVMK